MTNHCRAGFTPAAIRQAAAGIKPAQQAAVRIAASETAAAIFGFRFRTRVLRFPVPATGEVAEWSIAPHSKCGVGQPTVGSNPILSAIFTARDLVAGGTQPCGLLRIR